MESSTASPASRGESLRKGQQRGPPGERGVAPKAALPRGGRDGSDDGSDDGGNCNRGYCNTLPATESDGCGESAGDPVKGKRWGLFL